MLIKCYVVAFAKHAMKINQWQAELPSISIAVFFNQYTSMFVNQYFSVLQSVYFNVCQSVLQCFFSVFSISSYFSIFQSLNVCQSVLQCLVIDFTNDFMTSTCTVHLDKLPP